MDRFRNVVVGLDLSGDEHLVEEGPLRRFSRVALEKAIWVARRNRAALHLLTTLDIDVIAEELLRKAIDAGRPNVRDAALARLDQLAAPAREAGLAVTLSVEFGNPAAALLADVAAHGRDLVVVGTRTRSALARRLLGSTARRLLIDCPAAVWVAREGPSHEFRTVLAPIDFDGVAPDVLRLAESFATETGARLHVAHVVDYSAEAVLRAGDADDELVAEYHRQREADARARFDGLVGERLERPSAAVRHLLAGSAAPVVLELAGRLDADLVVMGARGSHDAGGRLLLGGTADRVLPLLDTSLLVLKPRPVGA